MVYLNISGVLGFIIKFLMVCMHNFYAQNAHFQSMQAKDNFLYVIRNVQMFALSLEKEGESLV